MEVLAATRRVAVRGAARTQLTDRFAGIEHPARAEPWEQTNAGAILQTTIAQSACQHRKNRDTQIALRIAAVTTEQSETHAYLFITTRLRKRTKIIARDVVMPCSDNAATR